MKKKIGLIIGLIILIVLGIFIYKFFIDCNKITTTFNRLFTLQKLDYAVIEDEVIIKLLDIEDNHCYDPECQNEGQYVVKLLVLNDHHLAYVELGTLTPLSVTIDKLKLEYTINLDSADENGATLSVVSNEN